MLEEATWSEWNLLQGEDKVAEVPFVQTRQPTLLPLQQADESWCWVCSSVLGSSESRLDKPKLRIVPGPASL